VKHGLHDESLTSLEQALEHFAACERAGGERYAWASALEQASTLAALKRYAEAIPFYQRAVNLMGDDVDMDVVAGLGFALLQNKQYQEAVPPLLAVVRADPKRVETYNHLASALYLSENYPGTIQLLDRRAQLAEETRATLFLRAVSYDKLAQCRPAIDFYEKFLALNGDEPNDQYFQATGRLRLLRNTCRDRRR
ncbi:MAG: tetratricopeptide repeat protein, partial [Terriglobia bacterium]